MTPFERAKRIMGLLELWNPSREDYLIHTIKDEIQDAIRQERQECAHLAENYQDLDTDLWHSEQTAIKRATGLGIAKSILARYFT